MNYFIFSIFFAIFITLSTTNRLPLKSVKDSIANSNSISNLLSQPSFNIPKASNPIRFFSRPTHSQRQIQLSGFQSNCTTQGDNNSSTIQLGNCELDTYYVELKLGSNKQTLNFLFDTGSDILWIPWIGQNNITEGFDSNQSKTFNITNQTMTILYASGDQISGKVGYDTVRVAQTDIDITANILFASNTSGSDMPDQVLGLVGMGYTSTPNFLDLAYAANHISTPAFSLDLNYANETSYLYYDNGLPQKVAKQTIWIDQYETGHWQLEIIGVWVGQNEYTDLAADYAVIDSGTSWFYMHTELFNAVVDQYFSDDGCKIEYGSPVCPCKYTSKWPDFSFMFIGAEVYLKSEQYIFNFEDGNCQANFGVQDDVKNLLLGDIFFRAYTISFDKLSNQIGFYGQLSPVHITGEDLLKLSQYIISGIIFAVLLFGLYAAYVLFSESRKIENVQVVKYGGRLTEISSYSRSSKAIIKMNQQQMEKNQKDNELATYLV